MSQSDLDELRAAYSQPMEDNIENPIDLSATASSAGAAVAKLVDNLVEEGNIKEKSDIEKAIDRWSGVGVDREVVRALEVLLRKDPTPERAIDLAAAHIVLHGCIQT